MMKMKKNFIITVTLGLLIALGCKGINETAHESPGAKGGNNTVKPNHFTTESSIIPGLSDKVKRKDSDKFKNLKVKGIYLSGPSIGSKRKLNNIIKLVNSTELNSVVIDVKDDFGRVNYATKVKEVVNLGAFHKYYDPQSVIKRLHENNIYVIGRIVTFKDPVLAEKCHVLAIRRADGQIYKEHDIAWVDPFKREAWDYNIDIAREAASLGFDEIQFDYVRFPAVNLHEVKFDNNSGQKADAIDGFLSRAYQNLHNELGVKVSANVFGIICENPNDSEGIGQDIEKVGRDIDYISPMLYPSHFANKSQNGKGQTINGIKFPAPDLMAYKVVYNSLIKAKRRIAGVRNYKASVRPYLQGFTASWLHKGYYKKYTPYDIQQQIKAVKDAGYQEWLIWNASNIYNQNEFAKG